MSRTHFVLYCCLALTCLTSNLITAKTVFHRGDKISDDFKQLNLPADEIDPNVAPPEPQKVETISPEDVIQPADNDGALEPVAEDVLEETEDNGNEAIDETINEIDSAAVTVAPAAAAAAPASVTPAPVPASTTPVKNEDDQNPISKYCKCTASHCDCCRTFGIGPIRGPGCAKVTYLGDERMSVSIKYGDITLATRTISGKRARPICVGLPGGFSQFCGRVYGLSKAKENFKACLGFELRADDEVEAALRVSCFRFGPEGLRVAEAEPLPSEANREEEEDDEDIFGFGAGGDDEDEEEYEGDDDEEPAEAEEPEEAEETEGDDDYTDDEAVEAPADADYGGFSLGGLIDELTDDDDEEVAPERPIAAVTPVEAGARTPEVKADASEKKSASGTNVQGKEEKPADAAVASSEGHEVSEAAPEDTLTAVTTAAEASSPTKVKKGKKAKKNKKKKAASAASESYFALELLNGILDFFN